jgi:hypothetical protein
MSETTAADRCQGVLVGLAAGDRIGGPIRMALRLAESLVETGQFDPADMLGRYLAWWREGAFDTGPVSARVLALVAAGMPVKDATAQVHREFGGKTAGCNPAHRSSPLSMFAAITDEDLAGCAMTEARLTHHAPPGRRGRRCGQQIVPGAGPWGSLAERRTGGWQLRRPGGAGQQRRLCAGRAAGGAVLRRHVGLLHRGAGSVTGVRRAVQLQPGPRGGRRRCPLGSIRHSTLGAGPRRYSSQDQDSGRNPRIRLDCLMLRLLAAAKQRRGVSCFSAGRFERHRPGRRSLPGRPPDLSHPDHPCGTPCVYPCRSCERPSWPWNDTGTPCCAVSGQGAGTESGAVRRTDATDSGTWKRAEGSTFGVAHGPKGLSAPLGLTRGTPLKINRTKATRTASRDRRKCQSACWQTRKG